MNEDRGLLQVVSGTGEFNEAVVQNFLSSNRINRAGVDYQIVAITGPQSSGKSTLLNHVFGTKFEEMDAYKGRGQTTKGIWLARATSINHPPTLVMDLEGSDGRERGEDDTSFERQSSLFALATADVLCINIWAHDIGRETGSGKPLLKTVLQVNLKLFGPAPNRRRTVLLFVFRDRTKTPLEILVKTWNTDMKRLWDSIAKPDQFAQSDLTDFFEVQYAALPNFELREDEFKEESVRLRQTFQPDVPGSLVRITPDKLPGDALGLSMQSIWKVIREQKDLNLPAHKVMVANIRCAEIAADQLQAFQHDQAWQQLSSKASSTLLAGFGTSAASLIDSAITGYDDEARYFDHGVKQAKQQELLQKLHQVVSPSVDAQLGLLHQAALTAFRQSFKAALQAHPGTFASSASRCKEESMELFQQHQQEIAVAGMELDQQTPLAVLVSAINTMVSDLRHAEMKRLMANGCKSLGEIISAPARSLLDDAPDDLWPRLGQHCARALASVSQAGKEALAGYDLTSDEEKAIDQQLHAACHERVESFLQEASHTLPSRLRDRFTQRFNRDEHNLPRVWGTRTKIPQITAQSRRAAAKLLALLAVNRLQASKAAGVKVDQAIMAMAEASGQQSTSISDTASATTSNTTSSHSTAADTVDMLTATEWPGVPPAHVLQTPSQCRTLWRQFVSDSELSVQQAMATQQAQLAASNRMPPLWTIALLFCLGWNEAVAVLRNPFWLVTLSILGLFGWTLYKELDVDAELQHGPLPAALSLSAKIGPAIKNVVRRTGAGILTWLEPGHRQEVIQNVQVQARSMYDQVASAADSVSSSSSVHSTQNKLHQRTGAAPNGIEMSSSVSAPQPEEHKPA